MSFRSTSITVLILLILGVGAGGGVYLAFQQRQATTERQWEEARGLIKSGKVDDALTALDALSQRVRDKALAGEIAIARVDLLMTKKSDKAYTEAKRLAAEYLATYPSSLSCADALAALGRISLAEGDKETARGHFNRLRQKYPKSPAASYAILEQAKIMSEQNSLEDAKVGLDTLLEQPLTVEVRREAEGLLGDINVRILYSRIQLDGDEVVHIKRGDTLGSLSKTHNVPMDLLQRKNNITSTRNLSIGQRVIIPVNKFSVVVDRSDNSLTVYDDQKVFKRYPCRTGREEYMTPTGEFSIINKKTNPEWTDPATHKRYKGGDPANELGTRWMSFQGAMLGIHGTIHPDSIGLYTSKGCIGMLRDDVEELFDYLPLKTPLTIVGDQDPDIRTRTAEYFKQANADANGAI